MSQPEHLRYYDVACRTGEGRSAIGVLLRRAMRRILLPLFVRNVQLIESIVNRLDADESEIGRLRDGLRHLEQRQDELATKLPATIAFGWDYVAMTRRLATLEDQVESLHRIHRGESPLPPNLKVDRAESHRPMGGMHTTPSRSRETL